MLRGLVEEYEALMADQGNGPAADRRRQVREPTTPRRPRRPRRKSM
jgi:hypothetical protein